MPVTRRADAASPAKTAASGAFAATPSRSSSKAAAQVFARRGYAGATTNHIAERAGVSIGSLYEYFPSKDALLVALMEAHIRGGRGDPRARRRPRSSASRATSRRDHPPRSSRRWSTCTRTTASCIACSSRRRRCRAQLRQLLGEIEARVIAARRAAAAARIPGVRRPIRRSPPPSSCRPSKRSPTSSSSTASATRSRRLRRGDRDPRHGLPHRRRQELGTARASGQSRLIGGRAPIGGSRGCERTDHVRRRSPWPRAFRRPHVHLGIRAPTARRSTDASAVTTPETIGSR